MPPPRIVSSMSSKQYGDETIRDLGRYPSISAASGTSMSSRHSGGSGSNHPNHLTKPQTPRKNITSTYAPSVRSLASSLGEERHADEYHYPRPSDTEIEALFRQLIESRSVETSKSANPSRNSAQANIQRTTSHLSVDIKWEMVEADARARWEASREGKRRQDDPTKSGKGRKPAGTAGVQHPPAWFLKKIVDGTITLQNMASLEVSLRTLDRE